MDGSKLIFFGFLVIWAGIQIMLVYYLYSKNHKKYYLSYLYHLLFLYLYFAINLFGRHLINTILSTGDIPDKSQVSIGLTINFLAWPLMVLAIYLFILFSYQITNRILPRTFKIFYLTISLIEMGLFTLLIVEANQKGVDNWVQIDKNPGVIIGNITIVLFILFAIFQFIFSQNLIPDRRTKQKIRNFGLIYLFIYSLWFIYLYMLQFTMRVNFYLFYTLLFSMHLGPVLYLKLKLQRILQKPQAESAEQFELLFKKYQITPKEGEVILLIKQGKSNQEISDILFVSLQTVKNYIYQIFKKTGVKSRTALIHFIQKES